MPSCWIWVACDGTPWGSGSDEAEALGDALRHVLVALRDHPDPHAACDHFRDVLTDGDCAVIQLPTTEPGTLFLRRVFQ